MTTSKLVGDADHLALERLVIEAAWRVDQGRSETLADLFTEDGVLDLGTSAMRGREAIGHNVPQEAPEAFAKAVLDVDRLG
jgi:hypothetical protein